MPRRKRPLHPRTSYSVIGFDGHFPSRALLASATHHRIVQQEIPSKETALKLAAGFMQRQAPMARDGVVSVEENWRDGSHFRVARWEARNKGGTSTLEWVQV